MLSTIVTALLPPTLWKCLLRAYRTRHTAAPSHHIKPLTNSSSYKQFLSHTSFSVLTAATVHEKSQPNVNLHSRCGGIFPLISIRILLHTRSLQKTISSLVLFFFPSSQMPSFRRLISPQTVSEPPQKKSRSLISRLMSFFGSETPTTRKTPKTTEFSAEVRLIEQDPLLKDFISSKKHSLSVSGPRESVSESTPRTQTLESNLGVYQRYFDTLKTAHEDEGNDLERRLGTVYDGPTSSLRRSSIYDKNDVLNPPPEIVRERNSSPMLDLVKQNLGTENTHNNTENMPIIIEHEFAPLYKDEDGNLVRPPFINLDPRERYHLLQLKRSIEASESLQSRIKYMVNPHETKSVQKPGNMVETATQTHDGDYLDKSLNFAVRRRKLAFPKKRLLQNTRPKNTKGFFSGEFLYDVEDKIHEKTKTKLDGYLGLVGKPSFNKPEDSATNTPFTSVRPNPDEDTLFNTFSHNKMKSTDERYGLNDVLVNGKKPDMTLDSDFVHLKERISDIIKLNDRKDEKKADKKNQIPPSSGFKFEINKNDIESIMEKRNVIENPSLAPSTGNGPNDGLASKPLFSLGNNNSSQSNKRSSSDRDDPKAPKKSTFLFGGQNGQSEKSGPTFGSSSTPSTAIDSKISFSFGGDSKKDSTSSLKPETKTPPFGATTDVKTVEKPTPLFGKRKVEPEEAEGPHEFSFGTKKAQSNPAFSFGSVSKQKEAEKPSFSFGGKPKEKEQPSFSFGKTSKETEQPASSVGEQSKEAGKPVPLFGEKPKEAEKLSFSFGEKPKEVEKPAFSFGGSTEGSEKPAISFGTPSDKTEKHTFSFGKAADKDSAPKPSSLFGSADSKQSTPEPSISFGASKQLNPAKPAFSFGEQEKPAFSFGSKKDDNPVSREENGTKPAFSLVETKDDKPASTFGENKDSKPLFSFGSANKESTPTTENKADSSKLFSLGSKESTPAFGFGSEKKDTPAFNFGSASRPAEQSSVKPAFSFGSVTPSEKPNAPAFGAERPTLQAFGSSDRPNTPGFGAEKPTTPGFGAPASAFGDKKEPSKFDFSAASKGPFSFGATEMPKLDTPASVFGATTPAASQTAPSFGTTTPAFGNQDAALVFGKPADPSLVFGKPADPSLVFGGNSNPQFSFGSAVPQSTFNFGQKSAGSTPGFSKSTTPNFNFAGNQANGGIQAPQPSFGQNLGQQNSGGFNFNAREATPTGVFGGGNAFGGTSTGGNSREATPPAFGFNPSTSMPNMANVPGGGAFTPPVVRNRKLALPRRRR